MAAVQRGGGGCRKGGLHNRYWVGEEGWERVGGNDGEIV